MAGWGGTDSGYSLMPCVGRNWGAGFLGIWFRIESMRCGRYGVKKAFLKKTICSQPIMNGKICTDKYQMGPWQIAHCVLGTIFYKTRKSSHTSVLGCFTAIILRWKVRYDKKVPDNLATHVCGFSHQYQSRLLAITAKHILRSAEIPFRDRNLQGFDYGSGSHHADNLGSEGR